MISKNSKHIVKGSILSVVVLTLQMIAALFKIRIILINYGYEYYSIFQSSNGIFYYLILIEGGLSVAYLLKMYEPYAKGEYQKVQSLFLGLKNMLYKVATVMFIGIIAVTILYPLIVADNNLDNFKIRLLIVLCGLKFVIPYFFTVAKKQILNVVGKSYVITIIDNFINLLTDIIIICIAYFTNWDFIITVLVSVLMLIPSIIIYAYILHYYEIKLHFDSNIKPSYEASSMTKDIMAQKIAYLADNNVDQIILSTRNLLQTTVYTTFSSVVSYPVSLINQLISSFRGHMGVMLVKESESNFASFRKLQTFNNFIATVVACEFIIQAQSFVKLWVGETYSTKNFTVILFAIILFRKCSENTITIARESKDLYKESKRYALIAAVTNFVLSLILVNFFEVNGLLIATIIADVFVLDVNNYIITYHKVFGKKVDIWKELLAFIFCLLLSIVFRYFSPFANVLQDSWLNFIKYSFYTTIAVVAVSAILFYLFSKYMRDMVLSFLNDANKKQANR